jgi:hypothetical protein
MEQLFQEIGFKIYRNKLYICQKQDFKRFELPISTLDTKYYQSSRLPEMEHPSHLQLSFN